VERKPLPLKIDVDERYQQIMLMLIVADFSEKEQGVTVEVPKKNMFDS